MPCLGGGLEISYEVQIPPRHFEIEIQIQLPPGELAEVERQLFGGFIMIAEGCGEGFCVDE
jgi:hypothetical protein